MVRLAIVGPGAIGGTLAVHLAQNPHLDILVCARSPIAEMVLETPCGLLSASPQVLTAPDQAIRVDWVLVTTKAYSAESTKPWLDSLCGEETRVAIVQNGVEHVRLFERIIPADRLVPVMIDLPASRTAPGRYTQVRDGIIAVPAGPNGEELVALFEKTAIAAEATADFLSRAWIKLCGNCAAILPALTLRATGPVWSSEIEAIVRGLVEECALVARAEGADVPQSVVEKAVKAMRNMPEGSLSGSIHADRLAGNEMEIDARNGVVVRLGEKHGIPTPMNSMLVTLLAASASPWTKAGKGYPLGAK